MLQRFCGACAGGGIAKTTTELVSAPRSIAVAESAKNPLCEFSTSFDFRLCNTIGAKQTFANRRRQQCERTQSASGAVQFAHIRRIALAGGPGERNGQSPSNAAQASSPGRGAECSAFFTIGRT